MVFARQIPPRHHEDTQQHLAILAPLYLMANPSEAWVSSRSQWKDPRWFLDAKFAAVNWAFKLADGSLLTDPENATLLDELRRLFWSLFCSTVTQPGLSLTSVTAIFGRLRELVRWMSFREYARIADLDAAALAEFMDDLIDEAAARETQMQPDSAETLSAADENGRQETSPSAEVSSVDEESAELYDCETDVEFANGEMGDEEDEETDLLWEDELAQGLIDTEIWAQLRDDRTVFGRLYNSLRLWDHIYSRGRVVKPAVPVMENDPFSGRSAYMLAKERAVVAYALIPPLPDEVAIPIMNAANAWLGNRADDICRLTEASAEIVKRCVHKGTDLVPPIEDAEFLRAFEFSADPGSKTPWRAPLRVVYRRGHFVFPSYDIASLVAKLRGACSIVIHSESGVRPEEMEKIPVSVPIDKSNSRPPYFAQPSPSGLNQLWFLQSLLSKSQSSPLLQNWLIGSTPAGSSYIPGPVRAIDVTVRLLAKWRALLDDPSVTSKLFVHGHGANFPTKGENIFASASAQIRRAQRAFITECVDLSGLPDRSKREESLTEFRQTKGECIYPSQWRKTFAMYTVRVDPSMIPEVALQFHHMSVAMTESRYIGTDIDLLKERETQRTRAAASFMYERVRGTAPAAGRTAKMIDEYREQILAVIGKQRGVRAINVLAKWCEQRGIKVFPSEAGHCFVSLWPTDAECHKAGGTTHWSKRKPNYDHRTPSLCAGCKCFGIDTSHVQFWTRRYVENQTWVNRADKQKQLAGTYIFRERARQAASVLFVLRTELPELIDN